jgi:hypothetical protein
VATNTAVVLELAAETVALKVALVAPAATITDAGTVTLVELPAAPTAKVNPPLSAGPDIVAVQDAVPGVVKGFGVHANPVTVMGWLIVTVAPTPVTGMRLPAGSVAAELTI